jgi:hypothetical protein
MYKTILLPTDFTISTFVLAEKAIADHPDHQLDFLFVHGIHASDSITELMFFSKEKTLKELGGADFAAACKVFQQNWKDRVNSCRIELFMGFMQTAFNNFLRNKKVEQVYFTDAARVYHKHRMSADLTRYLVKSQVDKVRVPAEAVNTQLGDAHGNPQISFTK